MPRIPKVYSQENGLNPKVVSLGVLAAGVALTGVVAKGTITDSPDSGSSSSSALSTAESLLGGKPQLPPLHLEHKAHKSKIAAVDIPKLGIMHEDHRLPGVSGIAQQLGSFIKAGTKHHNTLPGSSIVAFRATDEQGHQETVKLMAQDGETEVPLNKATHLTALVEKGSNSLATPTDVLERIDVSMQGSKPVLTASFYGEDGQLAESYSTAGKGDQYNPTAAQSMASTILNGIHDSVQYPKLPSK